jgi:hypothetical protein
MSLHGCFQRAIVDFLRDLPNGVVFKPNHLFMIRFIEKYLNNYEHPQQMYERSIILFDNPTIKNPIDKYLNDPKCVPTGIDDDIKGVIDELFECHLKKFSGLIFKEDIADIIGAILHEMNKNEQVKSQIIDHVGCIIQFIQASKK